MRRRTLMAGFLLPLVVVASPSVASPSHAAATPITYHYVNGATAITEIVMPDGSRELIIAFLAPGAKAKGATGSGAVIAEPGECSIQGAWAMDRRCGTDRYRWPGYHPTIYFVDNSGWQWPVYEAAVVWNQSTALNVGYRAPGFNCSGLFCVNVDSKDYYRWCGDGAPNTWIACTRMTAPDGRTFQSGLIEFDDSMAGSYSYNQKATCHELGHALGLGHNVWTDSCMFSTAYSYVPNHPNNGDFLMLESIYS